MSFKIGISSPGDFHLGWNSLIRGEGRYVLTLAKALAKSPYNEIAILGQGNKVYHDSSINVYFLNIFNNIETEFDLFFSMGDAPTESGLETNWMVEHIDKIKAKRKIFMSFFDSDDHKKSNIPVVYPYYYSRVDNEKTFCLPICLGSENDLNENNFNQHNIVWTTKNSHENPEYLYLSLFYAIEYVKKHDSKIVMIDGHKLLDNDYKDSDRVKELINENKTYIWWQKEWLPYNKMDYAMSKSKIITGIHHPIVGPSQLQIVFKGGVPLIFQNQKELPPYDKIMIPHVIFGKEEDSIQRCYNYLEDEERFNNWLTTCKNEIKDKYTEEVFLKEFDKFLEKIDG